MAAPQALGLGVRNQPLEQVTEYGMEDHQGQKTTSLTVGRGGKAATAEQRDVGQGGVAMDDLDHKPVENRGGSEHASPPGMAHRATCRENGFRGEMDGDVLSDLRDNGINPVMHQRASCAPWSR